MRLWAFLPIFWSAVLASDACGATFTVTNISDAGAGSLRQAIADANANALAGPHAIRFDLPGTGTWTIAPVSPLPAVRRAVVLDGYTQPGAQTNTLNQGFNAMLLVRLDGVNAGAAAAGLTLQCTNTTVRGLAFVNFQAGGLELLNGRSNVIQGNLIGLGTDNAASGNAYGILVSNSAYTIIGGTNPAARNIISGNSLDGVRITGVTSVSNQVMGNFIGAYPSGLDGVGNGGWGVNLDGAPANVVGGTVAGAGNLISWNNDGGVFIFNASSNRIQRNLIGTDVTGLGNPGNFSAGVSVLDSSFNSIGGTNAGAGNVIAFNYGNGVEIDGGVRNSVWQNSIFDNDGLGIDLGLDGVTDNDTGDPDGGANASMNMPELTSALVYSNRVVIQGRLNSLKSASYRLELFENAVCDDSGHGEGQTYLTNLAVTTSSGGLATLVYTNPAPLPAGHFITATATDSSNNTSEFATCMKLVRFDSVNLVVAQADSADPMALNSNLTYTITITNQGPTNATGVVLTDPLPQGVSFVSASATQGTCSNGSGIVTCHLLTIPNGGSATVALTVRGLSAGLVTNVAVVTSDQPDHTPEDNTSAESTLLGIADLAVAISDLPDPVGTGALLTYTLTVTNRGPDAAAGVALAWQIEPANEDVQVVSGSVSQGGLNLAGRMASFGSIPARASATLTLRLVPLVVGQIQIAATVPVGQSDPSAGDNSALQTTAVNWGPGVLQFDNADWAVSESGGSINLTVVRVAGDVGTVGVHFATSDGTAVAGVNYLAISGTLSFGQGVTSRTITVPILDHTDSACNATFDVRLFDPTGFPVLVGRTNAGVIIFDDDLTPQGATAAVSVSAANPRMTGNASSAQFSLSADGLWVAFSSSAGNLVSGDANGAPDIYARDLGAGTTRMVSANLSGTTTGNGYSSQPSMAQGGRFVAFSSYAQDLVTASTTGFGDVFLRDLSANTTALVSIGPDNLAGGNLPSQDPAISSNGLTVAFTSLAVNLVAEPNPGGSRQVFSRDMAGTVTRLVSINRLGNGAGNGQSTSPRISSSGRLVAFESMASDLVANDTNNQPDVFVRDLVGGTIVLAGINGPDAGSGNGSSCCAILSADDRLVVFQSDATDLVPGGSQTSGNLFVRDLLLGTTRLVSANTNGLGGNGASRNAALSADGRFVAFASDASDLVPADRNGRSDVFIRDLIGGTTTLVTVNCDGSGPANGDSDYPSVSGDGRFVAFLSQANDLAPGNFLPGTWQVYRRDRVLATTALVTVNTNRTGGGNDSASAVSLSVDGRVVLFGSAAGDLVPGDQNGVGDIFTWLTPPSLSIRMANPDVVLEWQPAAWPGMVLQTTDHLGPAVTWGAISNVVSPFVVTNATAGSRRFYRLLIP